MAEQARIFEKFYRVQTAESQRIPGTGLGLGIVREIMHRHGGSIEVDSTLGRGTRVQLNFRPLVPRAGSGS